METDVSIPVNTLHNKVIKVCKISLKNVIGARVSQVWWYELTSYSGKDKANEIWKIVSSHVRANSYCCDEQTRDCFDQYIAFTSLDKLWKILWPMIQQCWEHLANQRSALCSHRLAIVTRLIPNPSHKIIQTSGVNRIPCLVSSTVWFLWDSRNIVRFFTAL